VRGCGFASASSAAHPDVVVTRNCKTPKSSYFYRQPDVSPPVAWTIPGRGIDTLVHAILERVFFVKNDAGELVPCPQPEPNRIREALKGFSTLLSKTLPVVAPYTKEEFLATYDSYKRGVYERAFNQIESSGAKPSDSVVNAFPKKEKTNVSAKPNPVPRVISPRHPKFGARVGPFIKKVEPIFVKAIARIFGSETIMKGKNARQVGEALSRKWGRFKDPVAIALDASRFDQHVSADALRWEHSQYLKCFAPCDRRVLADLLKQQIDNVAYGRCEDGEVKYKVKGVRMSGDMNTGLGNCLLMCSMMHSYMLSIGITEFELANNGDDCCLILEREHVALIEVTIKPWFLRLGFEMEVEGVVYIFERIKFCQCSPVHTPAGYIMVRSMPNSLSKDCVSLQPLVTRNHWLSWRKAIGQCGLALTTGIPIAQAFYHCLLRGTDEVKASDLGVTGMSYLARGMTAGDEVITDDTRYSFWLAFGILPDVQCEIEAFYDQHVLEYRPSEEEYKPTDFGYIENCTVRIFTQ